MDGLRQDGVAWPVFAAWLVALAATLAAVFIGEVMGQAPCTLCWWQRVAMVPLAVVLGLGVWAGDGGVRRYALPLAVLGGGVALWHCLVYAGVVPAAMQPCAAGGPPCSGDAMRLGGVVPIPYLSLAAFAAIIVLLVPRRGAAGGDPA